MVEHACASVRVLNYGFSLGRRRADLHRSTHSRHRQWIADHERRTLLYNHRRPHLAFGGRTPAEVYYGDRPAVLLSAGGGGEKRCTEAVCGRMTAPRRRRGAPGSVGLRPPSPGARPTAPAAPASGGNADGGHRSRTIDEGPVRTQDTKSRGHQNQSGTILVWPSNCLNEPDHLSVMMVLVTVQSVGEDPGRLFMERTVLFDIDRVRKLSDPQRWGADRSVACRHTRSAPARTARDRRPFSVNPVLTSRKLSRGFEDPRWTGMAAVRAEAEGDDVERRIDERRWRAGGRQEVKMRWVEFGQVVGTVFVSVVGRGRAPSPFRQVDGSVCLRRRMSSG